MNRILSLFISVFSILTYSQSKKNEDIIVSYSAISSNCAQWKIESSNPETFIYLEKSNDTIIDANEIWDGNTKPLKIQVIGKFKKGIGLPIGMSKKGNPKPGRVFVYEKIKIIKYK